jgi:hypothetical protein
MHASGEPTRQGPCEDRAKERRDREDDTGDFVLVFDEGPDAAGTDAEGGAP